MDEFWKLETIGIKNDSTDTEDQELMNHLRATVIRNQGRYGIK